MNKFIQSILAIGSLCVVSVAGAASNHNTEVAADYVKIKHPVITVFPNSTNTAILSLEMTNRGHTAHTLVAAMSPFAQIAKLNQGVSEDSPVNSEVLDKVIHHSLTLKPQSEVRFAPQAEHIVLNNLSNPLTAGDHVPVTLLFADGSHVKIRAVAVVTQKSV